MNKLDLSSNGGEPHTGDDLMYLQSAVRKAIGGSLSYLRAGILTPDTICVLSGCVISISGPTFTYTEGYIWEGNSSIEGEVYYVPAQSTPQPLVSGGTFSFGFVNTPNPLGANTYQNLTSVNNYFDRYAVIGHNTSGSNEYLAGSLLVNVLKELVLNSNTFVVQNVNATAWTNLVPTNSWISLTGPQTAKWRIDELGNLIFRGSVFGGSATNQAFFNLPLIAVPGYDVWYPTYTSASPYGVLDKIFINAFGVMFAPNFGGAGDAYQLDKIRIPLF